MRTGRSEMLFSPSEARFGVPESQFGLPLVRFKLAVMSLHLSQTKYGGCAAVYRRSGVPCHAPAKEFLHPETEVGASGGTTRAPEGGFRGSKIVLDVSGRGFYRSPTIDLGSGKAAYLVSRKDGGCPRRRTGTSPGVFGSASGLYPQERRDFRIKAWCNADMRSFPVHHASECHPDRCRRLLRREPKIKLSVDQVVARRNGM